MTRLLVGTSGYSYADWVGPVYPPGTRPEEYLGLYAREFDFVELNYTFYRQPDGASSARLLQKAGDTLLFAAKAHRSLTHERPADIRAEANRFRDGILPLLEARRLAAVLLQFPYSFHYTPDSRRHLDRACALLEGLPLAVEFRNSDWCRESVYRGLRQRGICLAAVDLPPLEGLPAPGFVLTSQLGYVRFHGRNRETWWTGDSRTRYDYLYEPSQLDEWAKRLESTMAELSTLVVAFNNHYRGQAVMNARHMLSRLQKAGTRGL